MPGFHDVRFPEAISYGSSGGPSFSTTIMMLASGYEYRNINWEATRALYEVSHAIKDQADFNELLEFFYARFGRAYSFRFKDWGDFEAPLAVIATADGTKTEFQLTKTYASGGWAYVRQITKVVPGSFTGIILNARYVVPEPDDGPEIETGSFEMEEDVDYGVDYVTGIITFVDPPAPGAEILVGTYEFDVHVRFDTDYLDATHDFWKTQSWPSIPLVEVRA